MELFNSDDSSLLSYFHKKTELEKEQEVRSKVNQKSLAGTIMDKGIRALNAAKKSESKDPFHLSKYDQKLIQSLKTNGGLTKEFETSWPNHGSLEVAKKRIHTLQKFAIIDHKYQTTPKFIAELQKNLDRQKNRNFVRAKILQHKRENGAVQLAASMSKEHKQFISTLAEFRQMTPKQAALINISSNDVKNLKQQGLIESKLLVVNQKPITLLTLTQRTKSKINSGQDLARHGLGINKPFAGFQRDQSKLLHDVSVIDAMEHAKAKYLKKGYECIGAISEHRVYEKKTSPNSDLGQKYADAYMIFRDNAGDTINVAVEFGNYSPGYLKQKIEGINADQILVYTHSENKSYEYAQVIPTKAEVYVIQPPYSQELER